jgi:glycosyltransferase involved in cell wall biosynthesis
MWEAFSTASAVILPYRHIDQSGVLFQAFCFGLPVVAARVGEFDRYVSKDFGEVFAPADFSELRLAIRRLYQRRHEFSRDKIIARAQQLDWRATVSVLQPAYS